MFLNILPVLLKYLILYWSLCMSPLFEPRVDSRILAFFSTIFLEAHPRILFGNSPRIFFNPPIMFLFDFFKFFFQNHFNHTLETPARPTSVICPNRVHTEILTRILLVTPQRILLGISELIHRRFLRNPLFFFNFQLFKNT